MYSLVFMRLFSVLVSIEVRNSVFGNALVLHISPRGGGYLLGFQTASIETLNQIAKEIRK